MTKQDYELIASIFQSLKKDLEECMKDPEFTADAAELSLEILTDLTLLFANTLAANNRNFDKDRFIKACTK